MQNFIRVFPKAISEQACDSIVGDWDLFSNPSDSRICGVTNDVMIRNDKRVTLDSSLVEDTPESDALKIKHYKTLAPVVRELSDVYFKDLGLMKGVPPLDITGFMLQKSSANNGGGYHVFHHECEGNSLEGLRRLLVWTVYLNDVPEGGGETEYLYQGVRLQPKKGDLVLWPAAFTHTHRGNPVYTTDKYIVTGWMLWPDFRKYETRDSY